MGTNAEDKDILGCSKIEGDFRKYDIVRVATHYKLQYGPLIGEEFIGLSKVRI